MEKGLAWIALHCADDPALAQAPRKDQKSRMSKEKSFHTRALTSIHPSIRMRR